MIGGWTEQLATLAKQGATRVLLQAVQEAGGWEGRRMKTNHVRLRYVATGQQVTISSSPSDRRTVLNELARIRRAQRGQR